jgi:hypothetical protein
VLFLGKDPGQETRRILAQSKSNNAATGPSLAYRIVSVEHDLFTLTNDLVIVESPRLDWDGLSPLTANDLSSPPLVTDEDTSELDQAKAFLCELLADGPVLAEDVQKAAKEAGVASITLRRAKPLAGVQARRRRVDGISSREWPWEWYVDEQSDEQLGARARVYPPDEHLEHLEHLPTKSISYKDASSYSSEHLETEPQQTENQHVALDVLDDHGEIYARALGVQHNGHRAGSIISCPHERYGQAPLRDEQVDGSAILRCPDCRLPLGARPAVQRKGN